MSVSIRLSKIGKKNAPAFKIVAATKRDKLTGKYLDVLGHYNPSHDPEILKIDKEKYKEWVSKGARPSKAVKELVEGEYEFQHYTRQNEEEEEKAEVKEPTTNEEKDEEETTEKDEQSEEKPEEAEEEANN